MTWGTQKADKWVERMETRKVACWAAWKGQIEVVTSDAERVEWKAVLKAVLTAVKMAE